MAGCDFLTETFESADACAGLAHAFLFRQAAINTSVDKETVIQNLAPNFRQAVEHLGFSWDRLQTAEQVHGKDIAIIDQPNGGLDFRPGVDGLITDQTDVLLGIMVADCCAVYLIDPEHRTIGLLHSGKQGTELGITSNAIDLMQQTYGTNPNDLIVQLSPCIRPPHFEINIAPLIVEQALSAGVPADQVHDCGICTASQIDRYYSYRVEKGKTGRMLALLGFPKS